MRRTLVVAFLAGCGSSSELAPRSFDFGPYDLAPGEEVTTKCVQATLHNTDYLDINQVELTTATGFHHSNWFFVPEHVFAGDDGTFECDDRGFNEGIATILGGGVLFAQSTQATHEIQAFPDGVAVEIPPGSKIVAGIHMLNANDQPIHIPLKLTITPIAKKDVTTTLAGVSFENHSIGLPPHAQSKFTLDCDLQPLHQSLFGRDPDFNFYYALAHYHALGTGLTVEAVRPDGSSATVYSTANHIGDTLGGAIDPPFSMVGFTRLRFSCDYFNPRDSTVTWGVGDQEMCVFLAFTDSTRNWGGGAPNDEPPGDPTDVNGVMTYTHPCMVFSTDAEH